MAKKEAGPRIYRYIHVSDDGMAPCVDGGLLTLATCKPTIRGGARAGDWVIGCFPKPAPAGVVSWAARVAASKEVGGYELQFRGRSDAVYRRDADGQLVPLRADYHADPEQRRKDCSAPALVFDRAATWFFGDRPEMLPASLIHLAAAGQGHRVNGREPGDADRLADWLAGLGQPGIHGKPRHALGPKSCRGKPTPKPDCSGC